MARPQSFCGRRCPNDCGLALVQLFEAKGARMNRSRIQSVWCPILAVWFSAAATASLAQCRFPADATGRVLTYTFDPTVTPAGTILHVTLKFQGGPEGLDAVEVPSQWAGETDRKSTRLNS